MSASFDDIVQRYGPAMARLAAVYAVNRDDEDDLLQEVLLAVWRALPGFRQECSERTFVYRIAHNRGITHRARHRADTHACLDEVPEMVDPHADPAADLERGARREALVTALRSLPPSLRETVTLHLEELSNEEIAEVQGISQNNVAVRLTRARAALRPLLASLGVMS